MDCSAYDGHVLVAEGSTAFGPVVMVRVADGDAPATLKPDEVRDLRDVLSEWLEERGRE